MSVQGATSPKLYFYLAPTMDSLDWEGDKVKGGGGRMVEGEWGGGRGE